MESCALGSPALGFSDYIFIPPYILRSGFRFFLSIAFFSFMFSSVNRWCSFCNTRICSCSWIISLSMAMSKTPRRGSTNPTYFSIASSTNLQSRVLVEKASGEPGFYNQLGNGYLLSINQHLINCPYHPLHLIPLDFHCECLVFHS